MKNKNPALELITGKTWTRNDKPVFIRRYKELSNGLVCVFTDKMIYSIQVDEMEMFLESIGAVEALLIYQESKNKPAAKSTPKKTKPAKPLVFYEDIEDRLQATALETSGTLYTLHNTGIEWKVYILRSKVLLNAKTLKEILHLLLNEFLDKRVTNKLCKTIKNQKMYTYGRRN